MCLELQLEALVDVVPAVDAVLPRGQDEGGRCGGCGGGGGGACGGRCGGGFLVVDGKVGKEGHLLHAALDGTRARRSAGPRTTGFSAETKQRYWSYYSFTRVSPSRCLELIQRWHKIRDNHTSHSTSYVPKGAL